MTIFCEYSFSLQSSKLYNEVRQCKDETKHPLANFETPYVVHFQNRFELAPPQSLFTFNHPNRDKIIDNTRSTIFALYFYIEEKIPGMQS